MTDSPGIAVVIVHYGDPDATRRCLDALPPPAAQGSQGRGEGPLREIVLVDQPPRLHGDHPRLTRRIVTDDNLGFATACNIGVEATSSPFVLLLNNDAVLDAASAAALARGAASLDDDIAGAALKLLCMDGVTLQNAGGLWFTRDGIGFPRGFGERDRGQYDELLEHEIGVPSGAAALYRRAAWDEAGGMAGEFFCYCEDGDLGLRMVAMGRRFAWLPDVRVRHELSAASGAHSRFKAFHVERNHFLSMVHCAPRSLLAALPLLTIARLAGAAADAAGGRGAGGAIASQSGALALARTLLDAWWSALRALPLALERRRALLARHPRATDRIEGFLATRRASSRDFRASRDLREDGGGGRPGTAGEGRGPLRG